MSIDIEPQWIESEDDDGNSVWSARSPYYTDEGGQDALRWRLKQRVRFNRLEWYEDHDAELMQYDDNLSWPTIEEAKKAIAKVHKAIIFTVCDAMQVKDGESLRTRSSPPDLSKMGVELVRENGTSEIWRKESEQ